MSEDNNQAIRDIVKGASVIYVGLVLEMVIAFLAQLLAARFLSVSDFGGVTTGIALLNVGAILSTVGLGQGLTRYLPRLDQDEQRAVVLIASGIAIPLSLLVGAIVFFNAASIAGKVFNDASVTVSVRIFGAVIPFAALLSLMVGGIRGLERSRYQVYVENLTRPMVRIALVIGAVLLGLSQAGFAVAYAVPYIIAALLATFLFVRAMPALQAASALPRDRFIKLGREFLNFSLPFTVSGATGFVYRNADIFLVLYFIGSGPVGVYGVAYAAARLMLMFSTAMNYLGTPVASALDKDDSIDEAVDIYRPILRWLLLASLPALMPLLVFPEAFISSVYRPRYASGGAALAILALGFAVHNVLSANGSLLRSAGHSRPLAVNSTIGAVVNVALNVLLIPVYGVTGAAVATVAAYLLMDLMTAVEMVYYTGSNPLSRTHLGPLLMALPLYGVMWFVAPAVPATFLWLVGVTGLFGIVYWSIVLITVGLSETDVMILRSAQRKYGLKYPLLDRFIRQFS